MISQDDIDAFKPSPFKYEFPNRLYEVDYDHTAEQIELEDYFDTHIDNPYYDDVNGGKVALRTYHIDYGIPKQYKDFMWLGDYTDRLFKAMGSQVDINEFKHTLKFDFIRMEHGHILPPHTASYVRACCSINVPIRGRFKIDIYEDNEENPHTYGKKLDRLEYTSPILLNVNQFHGVVNDEPEERLVLKIHLMVLPYDRLVRSFSEPVKCFDWTVPWSNKRGTKQKI
tara:strand:- start:243 stop:923 length:681 start_codon:yes stop_codon:yes gene_type:complete